MVIKTDLHTHTTVSSHAYSTLGENIKYAEESGLEAIAVTNHAPGMPDSAHIWHFMNLKALPRKTDGGLVILRGAECSFTDAGGSIDLPENVLKNLDIVIASTHTPAFCPSSAEEHTKMLISAMDNPYIDILGHIDRVKCGADFDAVAKAAAENGKVIEMNEHSIDNHNGAEQAMKYAIKLMNACKKHGTMIAVNSDAHYCGLIGHFDRSLSLLESIGFDESLIINASLGRLKEYLKSKNKIL